MRSGPVLRALLATVVVLSFPASIIAQGNAAPSTPGACNKLVVEWRNALITPALEAYRKADSTTRPALQAKYLAANTEATNGGVKVAADCAAKFSVKTVAAAELMELLKLYNTAKDSTNSRLATDRLMNSKDLPTKVRAEALVLGMTQESGKIAPTYFGIIAGAEKYIAQLDKMTTTGDTRELDSIKMLAHRTMLGRYEYLDVADGLYHHATEMIKLARKLDRKQEMTSGYLSLARSFADKLQPDSALRILDNAEKEIGSTATASFKGFRDRYALIGQPATAITADWWINSDGKPVVTPAAGKVTLVEFTAHWCGPCKNSYPGLIGLAEKWGGKGFEGVMVTSLYGYVGTQKNLTPEQEVEADKIYFGTEHGLPFPVAINAPIKAPPVVPGAPPVPFVSRQPKPDMDYKVGGIPQIIIIDKQGIIRQIVTGWDQGNTARFNKLIEELLKKKIT